MYKESDQELKGNDRFEGFVFDVIDEISKMLGFNYTFKLVDDSKYGNLNKETMEWNGMIKELLDGVFTILLIFLRLVLSSFQRLVLFFVLVFRKQI